MGAAIRSIAPNFGAMPSRPLRFEPDQLRAAGKSVGPTAFASLSAKRATLRELSAVADSRDRRNAQRAGEAR